MLKPYTPKIKKNIETKRNLIKIELQQSLKRLERVIEKFVIMEGRLVVAEFCLHFMDFVKIFGEDLPQ